MSIERRDTPNLEAWCHDQRRSFEALYQEGVFAKVEPPTGWTKADGKIPFSAPKEFPMSYIAEQVTAPRGRLHLEPELIHWDGKRSLSEILHEIAMRGSLHPVSFKTLEHLALRETLLDPTFQRSLILPGVVGSYRSQNVYPVIYPLLSLGSIARRALTFRSEKELLDLAQDQPTAFFFAHKKPLRREDNV